MTRTFKIADARFEITTIMVFVIAVLGPQATEQARGRFCKDNAAEIVCDSQYRAYQTHVT